MFGRGKLPPRSHAQQVRSELVESYGHLKLAAAHVAGGAAEKLTPTYDQTRRLAARGWISTRGGIAPIFYQMKDGAANARRKLKPESKVKKKNRKKPALFGLLAAGAVAGAAGALITRRRRASRQWDEYEPGQAGTAGSSTIASSRDDFGTGRSTKDKTTAGVGATGLGSTGSASTGSSATSSGSSGTFPSASETAATYPSTTGSSSSAPSSTFSQFADETDDTSSRAHASRNGRA